MTRVALVPGVPALLPAYSSLEDPVAPLRAACLDAVAWLGPAPRVIASAQGSRVAAALLDEVASEAERRAVDDVAHHPGVLVVGNGSARRTDVSPGPFDPRALPFDDALFAALGGPDPAALRSLDAALAEELWADVGCFGELADLLGGASLVGVDYDDAPYGVQYWVMRWRA
ncbi:hypothetical protein GCM10009798_00950 [Nocardioides panacihumi]|uniref:Uncharacterized protein n=1 Tax=Nocardioides panacihumi TaxID=400774 RepID=A0ABN2Q7A4_9ACTN